MTRASAPIVEPILLYARRCICLLALVFSLAGAAANAQSKEILAPCIGYVPYDGSWGYLGASFGPTRNACPEGWAFMAARKPEGSPYIADSVPLDGACCPLPEGTLAPETKVEVTERCPDGYIATAARSEIFPVPSERAGKPVAMFMTCTALDANRFRLAPTQPGHYVGTQESFFNALFLRLRGKPASQIAWSSISASVRYAVGRSGKLHWAFPSCIGLEPGSVVTGKHGKYCPDFDFSTIIDLKTNAPLKVLPQCDTVIDPLDPATACRTSDLKKKVQ